MPDKVPLLAQETALVINELRPSPFELYLGSLSKLSSRGLPRVLLTEVAATRTHVDSRMDNITLPFATEQLRSG